MCTGSVGVGHNRATNDFVLSILIGDTLVAVCVVVPMTTYSIDTTSWSVVLNEVLRPDIGPDRGINRETQGNERDKYKWAHVELL